MVAPSATVETAICGESAPHQRNEYYPLRIRTHNPIVNVSVLGDIGIASEKPTKETCVISNVIVLKLSIISLMRLETQLLLRRRIRKMTFLNGERP